MQSLSKEQLCELPDYAVRQCEFIEMTTKEVTSYNDFLSSMSGMVLYNSTCMCLQTIGEALKKFDDLTNREILRSKFSKIPWNSVIGLRNVISHEYLATDPEIIFNTVKEDLKILSETVHKIKQDIIEGKIIV